MIELNSVIVIPKFRSSELLCECDSYRFEVCIETTFLRLRPSFFSFFFSRFGSTVKVIPAHNGLKLDKDLIFSGLVQNV